jgi:signal peptidase I
MSGAHRKDPKASAQRHPWRDNLEALTMAIVMAVMLKYFIVEAYKIPTGSMQPTLLGNDETGIFDRIIVDKLSYHYRDPERFEIAVFKYPLDRSKNFIKRVCGMPGEHFKIADGDLWARPDADAVWTVLRRPRPVQAEVWRHLDRADPRCASWRPDAGAKRWKIEGRSAISARGDGSVRLPNDGGSVRDNYRDGYPGKMGAVLQRARAFPASHEVGDLRIDGEIEALPGCKAAVIELREGLRTYRFEIPGPAAAAEARPRIAVTGLAPSNGESDPPSTAEGEPWRLSAGDRVAFGAQNMDDLLVFEIDGEGVLQLEVPFSADQTSSFTLRVEGEGADFTDVEVYRDIYYTSENAKRSEFVIPPGHYVMLGDNTQDSSDSREWAFARYRWPGAGSEGQYVRGNWRGNNENPTLVPGGAEGTRVFFRDEWGELYSFVDHPASQGQPESAPLVPRNLITGRALIVFWPFVPSLNVYRLQWIH